MNKKLLFGSAIFLALALAGAGVWWMGAGPGQQAGTSIPIELKGAKNLGSLQVEVAYDPAVLEPTDVKAGELAKNGMVEYNLAAPGILVVGVIDASGISGSGPVVSVSFKVLDEGGTSPISLERIEANDSVTLVDLPCKSSAGKFVASGGSITVPVIDLSR